MKEGTHTKKERVNYEMKKIETVKDKERKDPAVVALG